MATNTGSGYQMPPDTAIEDSPRSFNFEETSRRLGCIEAELCKQMLTCNRIRAKFEAFSEDLQVLRIFEPL